MATLVIKFVDQEGTEQTFDVTSDRTVIGRHSACDISISDNRLSREHMVLERDGDEYFATDLGSSNGSTLNDEPIVERIELKNGDRLDLGGLEIEVQIESSPEDKAENADETIPEPIAASAQAPPPPTSSDSGIAKSFIIIAVVMVIFVAVVLGAILLMLPGQKKSGNGDFIATIDEDPTPRPGASRSVSPTPIASGSVENSNGVLPDNSNSTKPAAEIDAKVEQNAARFLQKAAANDQRAFITGAQAQIVASRVKSLAGSSAVSDNIASARKSASAINEIAKSKNLKPQFVAAAAVAKLGSSRGDVLATARSMADTLDRFGTQIGNELGDDCLVLIAVLDQGDPLKMRNMLQNLATNSTETPRTIRSIWWLKKNGKITDSEYESALRFLAIGTLAQNPGDFGVNTEGWNF